MNKFKSLGQKLVAAGLLLLVGTMPAYAYVGPGAGLSAIGSLLALGLALLVAFIGFIWYPLKRLRQKRKGNIMTEPSIEAPTIDESTIDNTRTEVDASQEAPPRS